MKKLFVLGIALFFCLFFVGCSRVTTPPIISDNGGMDEYDPQFENEQRDGSRTEGRFFVLAMP